MTKFLKKKLVVVLGMHRSGTSAMSRCLQVMHVELGNTLMPPIEGNNPTGFWEDIEINALNIEMMRTVEDDWHHLSPINQRNVNELRKAGYFDRAVALLTAKVDGKAIFGFKDPRTAKLLPFWKTVFTRCKVDTRYVLALRHPLSVVRSLRARDGFESEKSYMLWLAHVLESLAGTNNCQRVLVDYDRLMQDPDREINRISVGLNLEVDLAELKRYTSDFLDTSLRHTVFELIDLEKDPACPSLVREIYSAVLEVASDRVSLDAKTFQRKLTKWLDEFSRIEGILDLADKLDAQKATLVQTLASRDSQISVLEERLTFLSDQRPASRCQVDIYLGSQLNPNVFDEENKVSQQYDLSGEYISVEIDVPALKQPLARLRLDPSDCPCVLELQSIELCTSKGEVLWKADTPANCFCKFNDQLLVILGQELLAWILCFGSDPNLELVVPQAALDQLSEYGGKFRLKLRGRKIADATTFESNDFRVMLRNETDPPPWAEGLSSGLVARIDKSAVDRKQLSAWRSDATEREQHLLTEISALATQSEALQSSLLDEHSKASAERARLHGGLEAAILSSANDAAQLLAARLEATNERVATLAEQHADREQLLRTTLEERERVLRSIQRDSSERERLLQSEISQGRLRARYEIDAHLRTLTERERAYTEKLAQLSTSEQLLRSAIEERERELRQLRQESIERHKKLETEIVQIRNNARGEIETLLQQLADRERSFSAERETLSIARQQQISDLADEHVKREQSLSAGLKEVEHALLKYQEGSRERERELQAKIDQTQLTAKNEIERGLQHIAEREREFSALAAQQQVEFNVERAAQVQAFQQQVSGLVEGHSQREHLLRASIEQKDNELRLTQQASLEVQKDFTYRLEQLQRSSEQNLSSVRGHYSSVLNDLNDKLVDIQSSWSWRLTAPFRSISVLLGSKSNRSPGKDLQSTSADSIDGREKVTLNSESGGERETFTSSHKI